MIAETTAARSGQPAWLAVIGLLILYGFGWQTVGRRLLLQADGTIVASRDEPAKGAPRYATEYKVRGPGGSEQVLWSGATDASLARSMPVGTRIKKVRWQLGYERDGAWVGFPYVFYDVVLGVGLGVVLLGISGWLSERHAQKAAARSRTG